MPRDARTYLLDIVDSCDAVGSAITGVDFEAYRDSRLIRAAVEREFIIVGEAMRVLHGLAPDIFARITQARRIIDFRNQLTHEYSSVNDAVVWTIALREAPALRGECLRELEALDQAAAD
jgi:uncharacterized protein with HEPN domain